MYVNIYTYIHIYIYVCVYKIDKKINIGKYINGKYICTYIDIYIYICIYIYQCCTQSFFLGITVHISNMYFSKSKGLKGPCHSWKLFQNIFYNL